DAARIEAEHVGDALHDDGGRALADLGRTRERDDRAVEVELEMHGRVRLAGPVDRLGGAADVVRAGHAEALELAVLGAAELALPHLPAARLLDPVEALGQAVAGDD